MSETSRDREGAVVSANAASGRTAHGSWADAISGDGSAAPTPVRSLTVAARIRARRSGRAGFTLIELLVAMSVTLLLLLFVNGVFNAISAGVRTGLATSDIVQSGRVVSDQLARDAEKMVGPADNGVLIITNQWVSDVPFTESDDGFNPDINQRRADQITFIRSADGLQSITPGTTSYFTPQSGLSASFARVNYGHALRTMPDGSDPADPSLGVPNSPNEYSAEWILGRQALLLSTEVGTVSTGTVFAQGGGANAGVSGLGTSIPASVPRVTSQGLTDIAAYGLSNEHPNTTYGGAMVGDVEDSVNDINYESRLYRDLDANEYTDRALNYTYARDRLRVNPIPLYDPDDVYLYQAWQMAQMHPMLATGVTDFVVEFAGDYDTTVDGIDLDGAGRIRWYSFLDLPDDGFNVAGSEGPLLRNEFDANGEPFQAFIFRHSSSGDTNWPHLIRIRYRVTDPDGLLTDEDGVPGRMYEQIIRVPR
ncbi:MAG: prepilin-type N-terminal cleavage/methylation domain-containing protein [Phycisphaeraceae bacterium]